MEEQYNEWQYLYSDDDAISEALDIMQDMGYFDELEEGDVRLVYLAAQALADGDEQLLESVLSDGAKQDEVLSLAVTAVALANFGEEI